MPGTEAEGPRQDTMLAPQNLSQYQALRQLGWIQPIDYLFMVAVCLVWLTLIAWKVFGQPTPWNAFACILIAFGLVQTWTVLLLFRCSHFILLMQAYLNDLPYEAARIVMGAYSGGAAGGAAPVRPRK